jgi:conjugative transfer region protein TrbK
MSKERGDRILNMGAMALVALAVATCSIPLRGGEDQADPSVSADRASDQLATRLAGCRSVTYEQKDALSDCRKAWAEKRRRFFREKAPLAPADDSAPRDRSSLFVSPDERRLSPAALSTSSTRKE